MDALRKLGEVPRSILIVTENWGIGGLESRIETFVNDVSDQTEIIMLVGSNCLHSNLPKKITKILSTDFFKPEASTAELLKAISLIDEIIKKYKVELVISHPFLSIPPSVIASKKNLIPCVVTLHGPASLTPYARGHKLLLELSLQLTDAIEVVSEETKSLLSCLAVSNELPDKTFVEIQKIDYSLFEKKPFYDNKKICLFSRLDIDKIDSILHLINIIKNTDYELHIFGCGSEENKIKEKIDSEQSNNIFLNPALHNHQISEEITRFDIVAGQGRAILEGVASNKPSLLIGDDGVKGMLDIDLFQKAKKTNFSGRKIESISKEEALNQLNTVKENIDKYLLRDIVAEDIKAEKSAAEYFRKIISIVNSHSDNYSDFSKELCNLLYYSSNSSTQQPWISSVDAFLVLNRFIVNRLPNSNIAYSILECEHQATKQQLGQTLAQEEAEHQATKQQLGQTLAQEEAEHQATKQRLEQTLAQEQTEYQATKQQLEQATVGLQYVLSSFSWKVTKPVRLIKKISDKSFKLVKCSMRIAFRMKRKHPLSYVLRNLSRRFRSDGFYYTVSFLKKKLSEVIETDNGNYIGSNNEANTINAHDAIFEKINALVQARAIKGVLVIDCAFGFDTNRNQRPIALAKAYAAQGYFIFFLRYQFSECDIAKEDDSLIIDRVYQLPRLKIESLIEQFSRHLKLIEKRIIITIPDDLMIKNYFLFRKERFCIHYDIMDDWEAFHDNDEAIWYNKNIEYFFINNADHVSAVSKSLVNKFKMQRFVKLVPNGTFPANKVAPLPREQSIISIGYFGHLTEKWFNWSYIFRLAEDKRFQIHIIGEGLSENTKALLKKHDNIFFHGYVQHGDLIKYIEKFEIGLIPFISGALSDAIDPLKVYEYLQHYRPVVSTGLPHIENYPYCKNASNFNEFKKSIISFHKQTHSFQREKISSWLEQHYWSNIASRILGGKQN